MRSVLYITVMTCAGADLKERRRLDDTITRNMLSLDGVTPAPGEDLAAELRALNKKDQLI